MPRPQLPAASRWSIQAYAVKLEWTCAAVPNRLENPVVGLRVREHHGQPVATVVVARREVSQLPRVQIEQGRRLLVGRWRLRNRGAVFGLHRQG
jgi:hypothetical protein